MSDYAANLGRAARLLKRIADISDVDEFEGVAIKELVADVLMAQNEAFMREAYERVGIGGADVIDLQNYSRKVPTKEVSA